MEIGGEGYKVSPLGRKEEEGLGLICKKKSPQIPTGNIPTVISPTRYEEKKEGQSGQRNRHGVHTMQGRSGKRSDLLDG